MKKATVLIVEDEEAIRDMLRFAFRNTGYVLLDAKNVEDAIQLLAKTIPNVIILDWMLPDKSGIEFIKWLRHEPLLNNIPVIMLTAKAEEENKVKGLTAGADDYITKPFSTDELIARVQAVLRRGLLVSPQNTIKIGQLILNLEQHNVEIDAKPLKLLPVEYKLLSFFATHPNKAYTRDQLIDHIYGRTVYIDDRSIDVQIKRLRSRLKPYGYDRLIKTVRGVGYCFIREKHEKRN